MSSVIEVFGLTKSFKRSIALNNISFSVEKGSITGFIGPNGSGKTTTIKILSGLLKANKGKVAVLGMNPWDNPKIRERISIVFDKLYFPQLNTVEDFLYDIASLYQRVDPEEIMNEFNLERFRKRKLAELSAGYKQKVQLASALLNDPELIIADEPTANLDPTARNEFNSIITNLNKKKGITFFISSHILSELERVITHVVMIDRGRIVASSSVNAFLGEEKEDKLVILVDKPQEALRALSNYEARISGAYIEVKGDIKSIVNAIDEAKVKIIMIRRSSLDDAFLERTGRNFQDNLQ
ncbi:putative branched-chain amino acid transport ATP-binding protein LivG [Sulfuracidifex tepidarius]|uniref:Branched-chain amino acid transport ATP-binding protein LivG n=1 Tax=Sulfuracidifex tepidarius TaxID=1294262 RepID=A0A510DZ44_9CREN|nr:ABC transporter ATP-binding protein [Sulfuracidifex tepidarius]BBG25491.1 putative branched-chain amino acid transport ATP-binding protein LivG [Sulfuracidifex tepidarius]